MRALRRLLYCGEWIESHVLHIYLLHAPDFLGYESSVELAQDHRAIVERGLQLKKVGNDILNVLGGRAIHPVNVRVGGFYKAPSRADFAPLAERLRWALDAAIETVRWVAGFDFPDLELQGDLVAMQHEREYPITEGRIASTSDSTSPSISSRSISPKSTWHTPPRCTDACAAEGRTPWGRWRATP